MAKRLEMLETYKEQAEQVIDEMETISTECMDADNSSYNIAHGDYLEEAIKEFGIDDQSNEVSTALGDVQVLAENWASSLRELVEKIDLAIEKEEDAEDEAE